MLSRNFVQNRADKIKEKRIDTHKFTWFGQCDLYSRTERIFYFEKNSFRLLIHDEMKIEKTHASENT